MKKIIIFIILLFPIALLNVACESKTNVIENKVIEENKDEAQLIEVLEDTEENTSEEEEIVGNYIEPLTGANIKIPKSLKYKNEISGQYGKGVLVTDKEEMPLVQLNIMIDEINVNRIEEAYEKLGFEGSMSDSKLLNYSGNYFLVYTETQFFDDISYSYDWVCLLTDGSVLHITLTTENSEYKSLADEISIEFKDFKGQLELASVYDLPKYDGSLEVAGLWENKESNNWFECLGGLLFAIYDGNGQMIDCGTYDNLFESLIGYKETYNIWINDNGLNIEDFKGVFNKLNDNQGILKERIDGIPFEGTKSNKELGKHNEYRGEWQNNTISCKIEINRAFVNIYDERSYSNYSYKLVNDGELELDNGKIVKILDDGGFILDGYKGTFYPKAEIDNAYTPYVGNWYNETLNQYIYLEDGGGYSYSIGESGIGGSIWGVIGKNELTIGRDTAYVDGNGNIVIDNCEGVFVKIEK